ncbi:MAG: hypothetical protein Ctma_0598 [Catillopecten margaritatus gill symbiont]|uniref:Uncharacterized protein n=1 Tax=Catillopecten margaritatus gill symbiont TaxID=3083288 RepID=A0AAU6PFU5_9GAMM
MDTLKISNKLTELGMKKIQSDFIAEAINDKNKEVVTKDDIKNLKELMYLAIAVGGATFGYVISKLG